MSSKFDYLKYDYVRRRTYDFYVERIGRKLEARGEIIADLRHQVAVLSAQLAKMQSHFPVLFPASVQVERSENDPDSNEARS